MCMRNYVILFLLISPTHKARVERHLSHLMPLLRINWPTTTSRDPLETAHKLIVEAKSTKMSILSSVRKETAFDFHYKLTK